LRRPKILGADQKQLCVCGPGGCSRLALAGLAKNPHWLHSRFALAAEVGALTCEAVDPLKSKLAAGAFFGNFLLFHCVMIFWSLKLTVLSFLCFLKNYLLLEFFVLKILDKIVKVKAREKNDTHFNKKFRMVPFLSNFSLGDQGAVSHLWVYFEGKIALSL
jgi:hypothetical protein